MPFIPILTAQKQYKTKKRFYPWIGFIDRQTIGLTTILAGAVTFTVTCTFASANSDCTCFWALSLAVCRMPERQADVSTWFCRLLALG